MPADPGDVRRAAALVHLSLDAAGHEALHDELEEVLGFIECVLAADAKPATLARPPTRLRADRPRTTAPEPLLAQVPVRAGDHVVLPAPTRDDG